MGAARKTQFQEISIRQIAIDHDLQSRVQTDMDVVKDYSEALLAGAIFPQVVIYYDGQSYWLADGFHRVEAYRRAGRVSIPADVRHGERRDAMIFSVGANLKMGLHPTTADRRKAVRMLLDDAEYFNYSDKTIAELCGVSGPTAGRYRREFCSERGVDVPMERITQDGRRITNSGPRSPRSQPVPAYTFGVFTGYYKSIGGKKFYLGHDLEKAKKKLANILESSGYDNDSHKHLSSPNQFIRWLGTYGIGSSVSDTGFHSAGAVTSRGTIIVPISALTLNSLLKAIGIVSIVRRLGVPGIEKYVICGPRTSHLTHTQWIIKNVLSGPDGIAEFLSPKGLVKYLKERS